MQTQKNAPTGAVVQALSTNVFEDNCVLQAHVTSDVT